MRRSVHSTGTYDDNTDFLEIIDHKCRIRSVRMITLRNRCIDEPFGLAKNNLLDDFRRNPSYDMIKDSILDLDNISDVEKSMLAATVDELCHECKIQRPDWIFDPSTYLDKPYFAMNAKGDLRIILLHESPKWYRSRNLFVTANCSERV